MKASVDGEAANTEHQDRNHRKPLYAAVSDLLPAARGVGELVVESQEVLAVSPDLEQRGESWYADPMPRVSICIDVPDLKAATTFYCDALGCSIDKEQASHNTLSVGGTTLHLLLKEGGTDATGTGSCTRTYERHWTPVHLDFDVDDVDAAVAEVKRLGGTVEGLKRGEWGAAAFCADPFGNGFCVLAIRS